MQSLNVLLVGQGKSVEHIKKSKFLNKLYTVSNKEIDGTINIKFNTFKELAYKCRTLQIDIVLVEEEKWILEGITDVMKQNYINCFGVNMSWTDLRLSHDFTRKMLNKYDINVPPLINLPFDYPVVVKGDGILKIANSMQEIISIKEEAYKKSLEVAKNIFLEKFLNGAKYKVTSLFDGKHLITFPIENIERDLLNDYSSKLENMFVCEKANFVGFFNSYVIFEDNKLYNTGFSLGFEYPNLNPTNDFLYICLSAIYQKLNEIEL